MALAVEKGYFSNIIGIFQVQKGNEERKECEENEKKRKEVRGD